MFDYQILIEIIKNFVIFIENLKQFGILSRNYEYYSASASYSEVWLILPGLPF
ncbi:hypothetical protein NARC_70087 [Candidatus Nitrosocosmicus arcticus]|uniref:Uncharacterized protein n=1 Tax=Candidatus Nitrosocosmicus arcticus TaxID=2035267 RepID=A0A557SV76_9ARCH|nr:hypothetical protein NARC_70087 [Candidatus Nitrosocosmicus arcticus]